jgi:hypothetical protein
MNDKKILQAFWNQHQDKAVPFDWLRGRSYSEAFVICLGAGPWKFNRRKKIQEQSLEKLQGRDLSELYGTEPWYPLDWQNKFLLRATVNLRKWDLTFSEVCLVANQMSGSGALETIRELVGTDKYPKVISLFCRDGLGVPSFPIDRHVRRKLKELNLPDDEDKMIKLCNKADIDPRLAAVMFVRVASDMDNPDWSVK